MHPIDWLNSDPLELPKKWGGGDFQGYLHSVFDTFKAEAAKLKATDYISAEVQSCVPLMTQVCDEIEKALSEYYQGFPHQAFATIDNCINTASQHHFTALCSPHDLSKSLGYLYRVRTGKPERMEKGQLFHIPFNLRHKVGPQRYSVPGLPSLYLGGSIYVCWEEMRCPDINSLHVSRFAAVAGSNLRVLDFGYRPALMAAMIDHHNNAGALKAAGPLSQFIVAYCVFWPLLAACSIRVKNREEPFKPEYVIPHLILQWITNTRKLDGVRYFSVNVDSYYDDPMACANFVFPVQSSAPSGHCTRLSTAFHLSEPVPWQLATGLQGTVGFPPHCNWKIELIKGVKADYIKTDFGAMQAKLIGLPIGPV